LISGWLLLSHKGTGRAGAIRKENYKTKALHIEYNLSEKSKSLITVLAVRKFIVEIMVA
jgi:DNA-binding HxlR family transcriptional regulator